MDVLDMIFPKPAAAGKESQAERVDFESQIVEATEDILSTMLQAGKAQVVRMFRESEVGQDLEREATRQAVADYWKAFTSSPIVWMIGLLVVGSFILKGRG